MYWYRKELQGILCFPNKGEEFHSSELRSSKLHPYSGDSISYKETGGGARASSAFLLWEEGREEQLRRVYLWPNFKAFTYPKDFLFLKQSLKTEHMEFKGKKGESNYTVLGINSYL